MDVRRKERKRGEKTPRCSSHLCISLSPATPFLRSCYGRSSRESFPTYICSSTIPFLSSPLLFTTLVPLRSRFSCRQLDLQSNRESRDPRLPGMKGGGEGRERNFCSAGEEKRGEIVGVESSYGFERVERVLFFFFLERGYRMKERNLINFIFQQDVLSTGQVNGRFEIPRR